MKQPALLCVSDARTSTGYAWGFINELYAGIARRAADRGMGVLATYREINCTPPALEAAPVQLAEIDMRFRAWRDTLRSLRFVWRERVRVVYLSDRPSWSPVYCLLRLAGARRIVVHDHTSGERLRPRLVGRVLKRVGHLLPGSLADATVAVSDFVADRARRVALVPAGRVHRIWNSVCGPACEREEARRRLRDHLGLGPDALVVGCSARAAEYKGVAHLLRAFDCLDTAATLVYFGDGPALSGWRELRDSLPSRDRIVLSGYEPAARELLAGADVAVVPSVWAEAFGMAALEPMAAGVPVVASRSGGLPEVVGDDGCGILVPPGDERALTDALQHLLTDAELRERMGARGRERAARVFAREAAIDALEQVVLG